jgi:hypothetical protein
MTWVKSLVKEKVAAALRPSLIAVMVVAPGPTDVARPEESIVATLGLLDVQLTLFVMSLLLGVRAVPSL